MQAPGQHPERRPTRRPFQRRSAIIQPHSHCSAAQPVFQSRPVSRPCFPNSARPQRRRRADIWLCGDSH
eukprot:11196825-Lingulodinium_polyedra.AAC.1